MNTDLCDEDGNLKKELTGDGIHLKASACELWHKFLCKNAIVLPAAEKAKEDKNTTEASSKKEEAEKAEKEASEKETAEKNTSVKDSSEKETLEKEKNDITLRRSPSKQLLLYDRSVSGHERQLSFFREAPGERRGSDCDP